MDGFTIKGKRNEYAMGQWIANMIKFSAELTIMGLCKGNIIDKTNVLGIATNYYESTGSVLNLEMNFTTGSCTIHYSVERLPLVYCLNAACSALLP